MAFTEFLGGSYRQFYKLEGMVMGQVYLRRKETPGADPPFIEIRKASMEEPVHDPDLRQTLRHLLSLP